MSTHTVPVTLTDFLAAFHPPDSEGFIDLRALPSTRQAFLRPGDIEAIQRFIAVNSGQNLYFGVATRKSSGDGSLVNCGELHVLFADIDFKTISEPEARAKLERFSLKPSIITMSGGGLHVYWLLQEPLDLQDPKDCQRAKNLLRRLVLALGGDLSSAEPARVLRIPGTLNRKPEYGTPRPIRIETFNPERAYNPSDFDDVLPEEPEQVKNGNGQSEIQDWRKLLQGAPNHQRHDIALKIAGHYLGIGWQAEETEALLLGFAAQCDPPYTQPEETADIRRIVRDLAKKEAAKQASSADPLAPFKVLSESPVPLEIDGTLREVVKSLGRVDSLRLQTVRQEMIAHLKTRKVSGAAQYVDAALSLIADGGGMDGDHADFLADPEPWEEPVEGAVLLDTISGVLRRYMVMTTEQADTCALWTIFAHAHDACNVSPILAVQSPVMGCGKSRLFSLLEPMLPRALMVCNLGAAALFRTVENYKPTLLIDEADTFMKDNEGLRGIVNSGWLRSSAQTIRLVGDDHETKIFSTWCPKAIAAIGKLPPTIQDRSIVIEIKRKAAREKVESLRRREANELKPLCRKAARWAKDSIETLREATPEVPDSLSDRQADSWSPLLAIADLVGGSWPKRARKAALMLSGGERDPEVDGAGVALIADCVTIFGARGIDRLSTTDLIAELGKSEERPWGEWTHGKPITPRGLAKLLKPFGIKPKVLRIGADTPSGYELDGFGDAHSRYVQGSHPQHCQQINENNELDPTINPQQTPHVEDTKRDLSIEKHRNVEDVEDRNPEFCWEEGIEAELDATDPAFESRCAAELGDLFDEEVTVL